MTLLTGEAFGRLFRTFERTAFRLETRDHYGGENEAEPLRKFLAGEPDDLAWLAGWLAMVREQTAKGRRFARVRVVSMPLTDYSRFGLWCAQHTIAAGEDIRYLPRDQAAGLPDHDFWLFDDARVAWLHYDDADRFVGTEVVDDPATVAQHHAWRDVAWARAVRRDDLAQ